MSGCPLNTRPLAGTGGSHGYPMVVWRPARHPPAPCPISTMWRIPMQRIVLVLAALALAACGGGGGGSDDGSSSMMMPAPTPSTSSSDISAAELEEYRTLVGGEPLNLTSDQIRDTLRSHQEGANRFFTTDIHSLTLAGKVRHAVTCTGATCSTGGMAFSPADLDFSDATYASILTRHGVSMTAGVSTTPFEGGKEYAEGYGGWLQHSAFLVQRDTIADADNVAQSVDIYALSMGQRVEEQSFEWISHLDGNNGRHGYRKCSNPSWRYGTYSRFRIVKCGCCVHWYLRRRIAASS